MTGKTFLLQTPTLAIHTQGGHRVAFTVPAGAIIRCVIEPLEGDQLVMCVWDAREITMFAVDILERGTLIGGASA
jgi:hypothetical protein